MPRSDAVNGVQTTQTPMVKGGRTMFSTSMHLPGPGRAMATISTAVLLVATLAAPAAQADVPRAAAGTPGAAVSHLPADTGVPAAARADVLAPAGCSATADGVTCDLWAKSGSVALPGAASTVTVWSFVSHDSDAVTVPVGPTLVVAQDQLVDLVLHNRISGQQVSLSLPQVDGFTEDLEGVGSGQDRTYTFAATHPGTYLYEAGGTAGGSRQVAMGLVGALVVLPASAGTAYGTPETGYTDEGVLVMSDVDPGLNAAPATYDLRNFSPRYHLFNGLAYPDTAPIPVTSGGQALLRVVNGGAVQHAIAVLGTTATVVGVSGRPLSHPYTVAAENVPAGDTLDVIVPVPTQDGLVYPVLDPTFRMDNDGIASSASSGNIVGLGGQLTFLQASGAPPGPAGGPVVTSAAVSPTRAGGPTPPPISVTLDATLTDNVAVTGVEYVIDDSSVAPGTGTAITGFTAGPSVTVSTSIDVSALGTGSHKIWVRGQDADGWGILVAASFTVDKAGPTVSALAVAQSAVNASSDLSFSGSAADLGGGSVVSATWSLDGGSPQPAALSPAAGASAVSVSGTIPAATLAGLADGVHTLNVSATDDLGNVGPSSAATFLVDTAKPTVGTVTVTPSPNDGTQGVSYDSTSIEVRATFDDPGTDPSGVTSGEGFLTTAGSAGTGFAMSVTSSTSPSTLVATVPLSQLTSLPNGSNQIWVRARDRAGNWGDAVAGTLVLQRPTTISGLSVTPSTTSSAATAALAATASAPQGESVTAAEYFLGPVDPGPGNGVAMAVASPSQVTGVSASINLDQLTLGTRTISVRAKGSIAGWGPVATTTLAQNSLFSNGFEENPFTGGALWNSATGNASRSATAAMTGGFGLLVNASGTNSRGYVTKTTTAVPVFHVRFQFNPSTLQTGNTNNARWTSVYRALGGTTERFRVEFRNNGTNRELRLVVATAAGSVTSAALAAPVGANLVQVDWASAASASVVLTVTPVAGPATSVTVTGDTSARTVTSSQLGLSQAPGTGSGPFNGTLWFDAYDSARYAF
jgi:hypothetical protein